MEWINIIITSLFSLIGALGGGTLMFYKQNKKLKEMEIVHTQSDEWQELYNDIKEERNKLSNKIDELYREKNELNKQNQKLELKVQKLQWYHCTVEHCAKRQPPHIYNCNGDEMSNATE